MSNLLLLPRTTQPRGTMIISIVISCVYSVLVRYPHSIRHQVRALSATNFLWPLTWVIYLLVKYRILGMVRKRKISKNVDCHNVRKKTLTNLVIQLVIWWFSYVFYNTTKCSQTFSFTNDFRYMVHLHCICGLYNTYVSILYIFV